MFNQLAYKGQLYRNDLFITVSPVSSLSFILRSGKVQGLAME
jgi:hypothetical protein